jgi:hypothetical protein
MPIQYRRFFTSGKVVAYGRADGSLDHLLVWLANDNPKDPMDSLADAVVAWNGASNETTDGVVGRTVLLCPNFDPATVQTAMQTLMGSGDLDSCWGYLVYWRDDVFTGGPFATRFPAASSTPVRIGNFALRVPAGQRVSSLDDFTTGTDDIGNNLKLTLSAAPDLPWSMEGAAGVGFLTISLDRLAGFPAGAVGLSIPWLAGPVDGNHPLQRVGFLYTAAPTEGSESSFCRVWASGLADNVEPAAGAASTVHLDPRDAGGAPGWINGEMNSRMLFGNVTLHSSFFTARGDRFGITPFAGASARLGIVYDQIRPDQTLTTSGTQTVFHPEGLFEIKTPAPGAPKPAVNIGARDLVAGSAATEFFDLNNATHVEFVKRQPCFLIDGEGGSASKRKLLDDKNGVAITSHVRFAATAAAAPPATIAADLHSQPAEAPLFTSDAQVTTHLVRLRRPLGQVSDAAPIFPRAGYTPASDTDNQDILHYDATHLSQFRRNKAKQSQQAPLVQEDAVEGEDTDVSANDAATGTFAITPQGILAEIDAAGHYTRLYFGNPDSQNPNVDFSIGICPSDANLFADIQNALAGNHLFMVLNKPAPVTLNTISPAATLSIRGFQFSVGPAGSGDQATPCGDATAPAPMNASVLIIKFFTGKSIDTLLQDPAQWACQAELAPTGNAGIRALTGLDDPIPPNTPDYLGKLRALWIDANWQGILVLDLAVPLMPSVLEALRPGLPQTVALRANHFGLNVVPARQSDVKATTAPKRPGSAFGLIRYLKTDADNPTPPTKGDTEPGAAADPDRKYSFVLQSLHVAFENSQISTFDAKLFIKFDYLFWDTVTPDDGAQKSLELDGKYESRALPDGTKQDVFSLVSPNQINVGFPDPSLLDTLTITRAQLNVQSFSAGASLSAVIDIDGTLTLKEKLAACPLFTINAIRLSSFGFAFDYNYATKSFTFGFSAPRISADLDFSQAEGQLMSLLSFLPVKLKGMSIALSDLLDIGTLGFSPISFSDLDPHGLTGTAFHFGFLMDLDLGSLGQLAGDLDGLRLPLLLGWRGGSDPQVPRIVFGIQFPTFNGKIDIGIQQFIRLQADSLSLKRCPDTGDIAAFAIRADKARVVLLGKPFPQQDLSFAIFVPVASNRKMSWALGLQGDPWYVGGGYRITIDGSVAKDTKDVVTKFEALLNGDTGANICSLLNLADPGSESWSIAAEYNGSFDAAIAVADPGMYGINLGISDFDLDLLYRRVAGQLGIFSVEFTIPGPLREMQFGAATVRLPVFRLEIHTDGGFLADFGYPWNNDFSRSAQVEVAIFLGSGGFYYGVTSALASDLLRFAGGYGFLPPDDSALGQFKHTVRVGFVARVGIGRSFTIGILSAEASITIFGGVEGAVAYKPGETNLFSPTIYAIRGFVGLMLDITATVDFAIIQASARILAYADVGLELRRVLAKRQNGKHCVIGLPLVIFADVGLSISIAVRIHIGCFDITIYLSFSATWHFEETLGELSDGGDISFAGPLAVAELAPAGARDLAPWPPATPFEWPVAYRYWDTQRAMNIYAAVLPCMGDAADFGPAGGKRTCAVGTMMLRVTQDANCFGDLVRFLSGWVLLNGQAPDTDPDITLDALLKLQAWMKTEIFWAGFPAALTQVIGAQFRTSVLSLSNALQTEAFAVIPLWPGYSFSYLLPGGGRTTGTPAKVTEHMAKLDANQQVVPDEVVMSGDAASFSEYCRHLITSSVAEMIPMVRSTAGESTNDRAKFLKWSQIWTKMFGN